MMISSGGTVHHIIPASLELHGDVDCEKRAGVYERHRVRILSKGNIQDGVEPSSVQRKWTKKTRGWRDMPGN